MTAPHVLVVEHDLDLLDLIFDVLDAEGYRVSRARTGAEALESAQRERPDVILVDAGAGGADEGVRSQLKERGLGDVPLLVVSGEGGPQRAARAGAHGFLAKPFDLGTLIEQVASMTAR
ncbi:MAG TPA: response regulator [Anaeromyxobacteraceae bacterium]|nr:response regulator [Anaeromyxobacteraceae bacterium]